MLPTAADPNRVNTLSAKIQHFKNTRRDYLIRIATIDQEMRDRVGLIIDIATCQLDIIKALLTKAPEQRDFGAAKHDLRTNLADIKIENMACFRSLLGARDAVIENGKMVDLTPAKKAELKALYTQTVDEEIDRAEKQYTFDDQLDLPKTQQDLAEMISTKLLIYQQMLDSKTELNTHALNIIESRAYKELHQNRNALQQVASLDIWSAAENGDSEYIEAKFPKWFHLQTTYQFINALNPDGNTPLHLATAHSQVQMVHFLLENKADPELPDRNGYQPLHWAAKIGNTTIAADLITHKAPLDAPAEYSRTPLHMAAYNGQVAMVLFLLSKGANINTQAEQGETPLHQAVRQGKTLAVAALTKNPNLDVSRPNNQGETALMYALQSGLTDIAALIVGHPKWKAPKDPQDPDHIDQLIKIKPVQNPDGVKQFLTAFAKGPAAVAEIEQKNTSLLKAQLAASEEESTISTLKKQLEAIEQQIHIQQDRIQALKAQLPKEHTLEIPLDLLPAPDISPAPTNAADYLARTDQKNALIKRLSTLIEQLENKLNNKI